MTDDAHALPSVPPVSPVPPVPPPSEADAPPLRRRAARAAVGLVARPGRWLGGWARRLALTVWFWVGLVLGFATSLQMWEQVLLLAVAGWIAGAVLWRRRRRPDVVALSLGVLLGWVPMLVLFVGALPHTMIGPPGVEYDL